MGEIRYLRNSDAELSPGCDPPAILVYLDAEGHERLFPLDDNRSPVTIGRSGSADLPIAWDGSVSRVHAQLERRADAWVVIDDGMSQNGTFVNELPVTGSRRLSDGDLLRVGQTRLAFHTTHIEDAPSEPGEIESPTLVSSAAGLNGVLSQQQQAVLRALCGAPDASPDELAETAGVPSEVVVAELDGLARGMRVVGLPRAHAWAALAVQCRRLRLLTDESA
jgi:pSer/pThr/pTyr-binding forkhead associated (FHA) protein